ncbi:MAG: hypothetical protein Q9187_004321 [Circinaria calcarea]
MEKISVKLIKTPMLAGLEAIYRYHQENKNHQSNDQVYECFDALAGVVVEQLILGPPSRPPQ